MAAEQSVLGAMLISPTAITEVTTTLTGADFYAPIHETIYDTIVDLVARDHPVDIVTVSAALARQPADQGRTQLDLVGGPLYVHGLANNVPLAANAPHYADIVRNHARLRVLIDTGTRLTQLGYTGRLDTLDTTLDNALQTLDDTVMRFGTTTHLDTGLTDMSWVLDGKLPPAPQPLYAQRTDGTALFYAGRVNGLFGDPAAAKTWLAMVAGVEALHADTCFAFVDVDHNGKDHTAGRLLRLGATLHQIADPTRFRYYEPEDATQLRHAITDITSLAPAVVVLDSIGEILPMLGVKSVDNDEISGALRTIAMPPAKAGSCVITIDHLPKSVEARATGYAIGGTAKKRAMDGAYLRVEAKVKPRPGGIGRMVLRIEKDRTGELERTSGGGYAGTFTLDSTADHITTWTIGREDSPIDSEGRFRPTHLMERVSRHVEDNDQSTGRDIKDAVGGKADHVGKAIQVLIEEGFISVHQGARRAQLHHSIAHYREAEDDHLQTPPQ